MLCSLGFHKPKCKPLFLGEQRSNTQKGRASIPTHSKPAESQEAVASSELCSLVSAPALPPPFTLKELELPLIDAQTCDTYYHENSYVPSQEPIILEELGEGGGWAWARSWAATGISSGYKHIRKLTPTPSLEPSDIIVR